MTPTSKSPQLLTVVQAAELLHMSESSIRSYMRQGKLSGFRIGNRQIRLDRVAVMALLEPAMPEDA